MSSSRLHRAALTAVSTALALVAVSTAYAADTVVEGVGTASVLGLSSGSSGTYVRPTQIPEAAAATAAAVSLGSSFVLTPSGVLVTGVGNLGLGSDYSEVPTFTSIPGTAGAQAVATGGDATLILRGDGTVAAFGADAYGQDGHVPSLTMTNTPTTVAGIDHVTAIAAGQTHALALKSDGTVWAWGHAPYLGNSAVTADTGTPGRVALPAGAVATAIAAGGAHSLALLQDGSVWGWGANAYYGQVGDGSADDVDEPVQVIAPPAAGAPRVTAVSAGSASSFALYDDGSFRAWGEGDTGQLGLGNGAQNVNVPIAPDPSVVAAHPDRYPPLASISAVGLTTYAIAREGGRVYGWGLNFDGQLGFGDGPTTYDFAFPYTGDPGATDGSQFATEIPQRIGRLKGAAWLGVGSNGGSLIVAATPTLTQYFSGPLPFFSQAVGTVSARKLTLLRSAGDPTTVTSVKITGHDAEDFEIVRYNKTGDPADVGQLPLTLDADQILGVYVRFYPSALGERNATLQVSGDGETASVALSGFGTALPGSTPGDKGDKGERGDKSDPVPGPVGPTGPAGPAGPAGKNGVISFTAKKATTRVKRGHTATLSFSIKNATKGRLLTTTATVTVPRSLTVRGGKAIAVRALAPGASRTVSVRVTAGRHVAPGVSTVKLRVPYGSRAVTVSAKVKIVR
jgi:alpha-tubulin suppressor-like RCC1 family protein